MSNIRREWTAEELIKLDSLTGFTKEEFEFLAEATHEWAEKHARIEGGFCLLSREEAMKRYPEKESDK